jgi:ABC-type proline/glycine betaine transport system permease subunit
VSGIVLAVLGGRIFGDGVNYFYLIPHNMGVTTEDFWQSGVDWMVENWYQGLQGFNRGLITQVLIPMKTAFLGMPVLATFVLTMGIGYIVGGLRSALTVGSFLLFIALTDWWDRALITAYMASFAVVVSVIIGFSVVAARNAWASRVVLLLCDTFQTFPSFIYLIPVIMLFGVTDTSVLIAVIIYATIPATRYTVEGLRSVPASLQDLGLMSGANWFQRFSSIELPLALPHAWHQPDGDLCFVHGDHRRHDRHGRSGAIHIESSVGQERHRQRVDAGPLRGLYGAGSRSRHPDMGTQSQEGVGAGVARHRNSGLFYSVEGWPEGAGRARA